MTWDFVSISAIRALAGARWAEIDCSRDDRRQGLCAPRPVVVATSRILKTELEELGARAKGIPAVAPRSVAFGLSDIPSNNHEEYSMSIIDKVVAAVTPPESNDARREARSKDRAAAAPGDWLSMAVQQHVALEKAFDAVKAANTAASRVAAQKHPAVLLTGHAVADEKAHATMASAHAAYCHPLRHGLPGLEAADLAGGGQPGERESRGAHVAKTGL